MVSSEPPSAKPRGSQIPPNSVVSGSERMVSLERAAFMAVEVAFWGAGAKAEAMLRVERSRAQVVFILVIEC